MRSSIKNPNKLKYIGYIVTVVSIIFIIKMIMSMDVNWRQFHHPVRSLLILVLFSVVLVSEYIALGLIWKFLLSFTSGKEVDTKLAIGIYLRANIGKYLPGNVMHFAGRNLLGIKMNINQIDIALSTFLEIALTVLAAFLLVTMFAFRYLLFVANMVVQNRIYINIFMVLIFIFILIIIGFVIYYKKHPSFFDKYKRFFSLKFLKIVCTAVPVYMGILIIYGLIFVGIIPLILGQPVTFEKVVLAISIYILSWLVGFVIPGAPGGIGVREAILILLLKPMFGEEVTVLAGLLQRVFSICGDVMAFCLQVIIEKIYKCKSTINIKDNII